MSDEHAKVLAMAAKAQRFDANGLPHHEGAFIHVHDLYDALRQVVALQAEAERYRQLRAGGVDLFAARPMWLEDAEDATSDILYDPCRKLTGAALDSYVDGLRSAATTSEKP
jgi:hypothetical protein